MADGQINQAMEDEATVMKAARDAMNGWDQLVELYIILILPLRQTSGFGQDLL